MSGAIELELGLRYIEVPLWYAALAFLLGAVAGGIGIGVFVWKATQR